MKKAFVLVVLVNILAGTVCAQSSNDFTVRTKSFNGTLGVVIMGYKGASKDVLIPASFNNIPVMEIADQAFMMNNIKSVVIPRTVVRIGKKAFYGNKIDAVSIPESVREIGDNAFDNNLRLDNIQTLAGSAEPAQNTPPRSVTYVPERRRHTSAAPAAGAPVAAAPVTVPAPQPAAQPEPANTQNPLSRRVVLPEEKRNFEPPSRVVFMDSPDNAENASRAALNPPVQNAQIPQRYAKAPPPLAAPQNNYSAVIPDERPVRKAEEKIPVVGVSIPPAELISTGNFNVESNTHGIVSITAYSGDSREVILPSAIGGKIIQVIGKQACWNKYLVSVKIPDTIVRIEDGAFSSNNLTEVVIPASIRYIGYQAFNGNPLRRITIGAAVPMQTDSFPGLFADFYRINGMVAGNYFYANGKWFIDR